MSLKKLTMKEAVSRSIKLWTFLAEDGSRAKTDWFGSKFFKGYIVPYAGCFLCEYSRQKFGDIRCESIDCPLKDEILCDQGSLGSAYKEWSDVAGSTILKDNDYAQACAETILDALVEYYEKNYGGVK